MYVKLSAADWQVINLYNGDKQYFNMDPIQISICLRPLTNWPAAQGRDPWPRSIVFCLSTTGLHDCGKEMGGGGGILYLNHVGERKLT